MKKKTGLIICIILAFCLAACGADRTGNNNQNNADSASASGSKPAAENVPAADPEEDAGEKDAKTSDTSAAETTGISAGTETNAETDTAGSHILTAYFSIPEDVDTSEVDAVAGASIVVSDGEVTGNTEYVAKIVQETVGGDLFRIETTDQYPLDHEPLVDQAAEEQDADARPELATHIENPGQYDVIILGFPNWWGDLPQPLYTFWRNMILAGKRSSRL